MTPVTAELYTGEEWRKWNVEITGQHKIMTSRVQKSQDNKRRQHRMFSLLSERRHLHTSRSTYS